MVKEVKVTLGVAIQGFLSGLNSARSAFMGFTNGIRGGIGEGLELFAHLGQAVNFLRDIFQGLINVAKGLFDTFVSGIAVEERLTASLGRTMGGAQQAKDFINQLAEENKTLGFVTDDMLPSINQFATALKAMDGSVKPERLAQMADMFRRIKAARPDLSADEITRAILQAARGDVERIKMLLGVGLDDVTGLSEKAQKTMQALKQGGDQQLGEVTKVAAGMKPQTQDMLDLFDEYLNKLGMTKQATADTANEWERNVNKMKELWDNFKDTVGAPILAALNKELGKLAEWLGSHQKEIDAFAEKIGNLAAKGLENAMEALMNVDWDKVVESGVAFADAFSKVDWGAVAQATADIAKFFGGNNAEVANDTNRDILNAVGLKYAPSSVQDTAHMGTEKQASSQTIEVKISVDDDGKLKANIDKQAGKAANQAVGNLVKATVSKSGTRQKN